jgi:hypothetical protein
MRVGGPVYRYFPVAEQAAVQVNFVRYKISNQVNRQNASGGRKRHDVTLPALVISAATEISQSRLCRVLSFGI